MVVGRSLLARAMEHAGSWADPKVACGEPGQQVN